MERYAWKAILKEGKKEEYIRRHNEIWGELVELLKSAGIENYSIWLCGNELFGYYECKYGVDFAGKTQAESPLKKKKFIKFRILYRYFKNKRTSKNEPSCCSRRRCAKNHSGV